MKKKLYISIRLVSLKRISATLFNVFLVPTLSMLYYDGSVSEKGYKRFEFAFKFLSWKLAINFSNFRMF